MLDNDYNFTVAQSSFRNLLLQREMSKTGALKLIDFIQDRRLRGLELSTATELKTTSRSPTNCLALEKIEYRYLLSGSLNGTISLFDLEETVPANHHKSVIQPLLQHAATSASGTNTTVTAACASLQWYLEDSGAFISASMNGILSIFDTNDFIPVANFGFSQVMYSARMRGGGSESTLIAVGLQDGTIRLCDPRTRDTSHVLKGHDRPVTCVDWCPSVGSAHTLASAGMDGAVRVWDVRRSGSVSDAVVRSLDWRGDFSSSSSRVDTRKLFTSLTSSHGGVVVRDAVQLSRSLRDHTAVAAGESSLRAGRAHDGGVMSMRYSSCGNFVVTSGNDQRLRMWEAHSGKLVPTNYSDHIVPVAQLPYDIGVAELSHASADVLLVPASGSCAIAGSSLGVEGDVRTAEGDILMIPAHSQDGQPIRLLKGHLERVTAITYRKPQQQVVSAGRDGMIFLWAPRSGSNSSTVVDRESRESSRQHLKYFGGSGGRYDFQRVRDAENQAAAATSSGSTATASARRVLRGPQLLPVSISDDEVARAGIASAPLVRQDAAERDASSEESGDDWSEDELIPPARPVAPRRIAKKQRTSAAAVVAAAAGTEPQMDSGGTFDDGRRGGGNGTTSAGALQPAGAPTSSSRSFMPPIIRQYLQDASREVRPAAAAASATQAASTASSTPNGTAVQWSAVESMFESSHAPERSATLHNPAVWSAASASGLTVPSAAAPPRSATAPTSTGNRGANGSDSRTADQRYAQWLKQMRSKAGKKK